MYYFENAGTQNTINSIIDYISIYQEILSQDDSIYYSVDYLNSRVSVTIRLSTREATIGFAKFSPGKESPSKGNYLFFNNLAEVTGASNPTNNNHESLFAMGQRAYGIKIPTSAIPEYIRSEDTIKLTYEAKNKMNM